MCDTGEPAPQETDGVEGVGRKAILPPLPGLVLLSRICLAGGLVLALVLIVAGHWVSGGGVAVVGYLLSWFLKVAAFRYR